MKTTFIKYLNMAEYSIRAGYIGSPNAIKATKEIRKWMDVWGNSITDEGINKMCIKYKNELLCALPNNKAAASLKQKLFGV